MARGARTAGSRFAYRIGDVALTEMALYRFVLDRITGNGFLPVLPPVLVSERAMYGTGYLPTDEHNIYILDQDGLYLAGTYAYQHFAWFRDDFANPVGHVAVDGAKDIYHYGVVDVAHFFGF